MKRPNVLLIMTDQQRYDSLGCYGVKLGKNGESHTPNLDSIAEDGALFERCYVTNPICTPSRAGLFTGKYLPGHGVRKLYDILPDDEVFFTEYLQEAGYQTALFGKLHVSSMGIEEKERHPHDGFEIFEWCHEPSLHLDSPLNAYAKWLKGKNPAFYEELKAKGRKLLHVPREYHMNHWAAERTSEYILRERDTERPFFAMMSVFDPHNPYEDYPLEMLDLIDTDRIPKPQETDIAGKPDGFMYEHLHNYLGCYKNFTAEEVHKMRVGYHASLALLDLEVGRVLDALREAGVERETLVMFVSDHGDMLGDQQLMVKGGFVYDPNIRVPLMARWPERIAPGTVVNDLVQNHDVAATVLAVAGLSAEERAEAVPDAMDVLPLTADEKDAARGYAVTSYHTTGRSSLGGYVPINLTVYHDGRYKLGVYHADPASGNGPQGELYDMEADPQEERNLWDDPEYAAVRLRLTERMLDWVMSQELRYGRQGDEFDPHKKK